MLKPINDLAMIEIVKSDEYNLGGEEGHPEHGVLLAVPDELMYFGFNSFAFDVSLNNKEALQKLYDYYKGKIGKTVYWGEYSERGSVIKYKNKRYAFLKLTSLLCEDDDPDSIGYVSDTVAGKAFNI